MALSKLYIQLAVDNDAFLVVRDFTDYEGEADIYDYAFVEMLLNKESEVIDSKITPIERKPKRYSRRPNEMEDFAFKEFNRDFQLPDDGEYWYMKLVLPKQVRVMDKELYDQYYVTADGKGIAIGNDEFRKPITMQELYEHASAALEYEEEQGFDFASAYVYNIFSIAYLNQCLLKIEKKLLDGYDCKQSGACANKNVIEGESLSYKRDLLMDAHRVLIWLLAKRDFLAADKILTRLNRCGSLCSDIIEKPGDNGCGCGKSQR